MSSRELPPSFELPPDDTFIEDCYRYFRQFRYETPRDIAGNAFDEETGMYESEKAQIQQLKTQCEAYMTDSDLVMVEKALALAMVAHATQYRDSGAPYSDHFLTIAIELSAHHEDTRKTKQQDAITIASALLHDVIEDSKPDGIKGPRYGLGITRQHLDRAIHPQVGITVEDLTKRKGRNMTKELVNELARLQVIESLSHNPRVVIIKLYDRLHNLRTLGAKDNPVSKRRTIIETQEVYIPLARFLGLTDEAHEMELLVITHSDYADKDRLDRIKGRHASLEETFIFMKDIEIQKLQKALGLDADTQIDMSLASVGSMYLDPDGEGYINVDISANATSDNPTWGKKVMSVAEDFVWNGFVVSTEEPLPTAADFYSAIKSGLTDALQFMVVRASDGTRFRVSVYPKDVYAWERASLTHLYNTALTDSEDPYDQQLVSLAREKQRWLRNRFIRSMEEGGPSAHLIKALEPRLPVGSMHVVGVDNAGARAGWIIPRGSSVLDYAVSISPNGWRKAKRAFVNGRLVSWDHVLVPGEVIHIQFDTENAYDPLWLHAFKTSPSEVAQQVQARLERELKNEKKRESQYFRIVKVGKQEIEHMLDPDDQPLLYLPLDVLFDECAVLGKRVEKYLETLGIRGSTHGRKFAQLEDLVYFGVGMGVIAKDEIRHLIPDIVDGNKRVHIIRVQFDENRPNQAAFVSRCAGEAGINVLQIGAASYGMTSEIIMYLPPWIPNDASVRLAAEIYDRAHEENVGAFRLSWEAGANGRALHKAFRLQDDEMDEG